MTEPRTDLDPEIALREAAAAAKPVRAGATERLIARAAEESLLDVAYAEVDSPFGRLLVAGTERGVLRVALPPYEWDSLLEQIAAEISPRVLEAPERLDHVCRQLGEYFEGRRRDFDLPLDWRLTHGFRSKAQHAIARIPYGETRSYGQIAAAAGNPRAFRAAGTACGSNPLPPIVPCHRVVPAGGGVGSYGGGPEMKRALLELEGVRDL
jgi:methylated-DNA-[protein]-cysteine S-methyltransferase